MLLEDVGNSFLHREARPIFGSAYSRRRAPCGDRILTRRRLEPGPQTGGRQGQAFSHAGAAFGEAGMALNIAEADAEAGPLQATTG